MVRLQVHLPNEQGMLLRNNEDIYSFHFASMMTFEKHYFMLKYLCISLETVVKKNGKKESEKKVEGQSNIFKQENVVVFIPNE